MERKEAIQSAYRLTGSGSFYDGMITCSTLGGKAVCRLVWDMKKAECDAYLEKACPVFRSVLQGSCWKCRLERAFLRRPMRQLPV